MYKKKNIKIIIINIAINWVYRLYEEYIESIKSFLKVYFKNIFVDILFFEKSNFENILLDNIHFEQYDKIFYTGDLEILKLLIKINNNNYDKIFFLNVEQMSHPYYYKMIRTIDEKVNIIDYSEENIPFFKDIYNKVYLIPPFFNYEKIDINNKDIDILSLKNNYYREKILMDIYSNLDKKYNILFFDNLYGKNRNEHYLRSKIYLNIHCSEDHCTMELIRIVNLIMNGVIIVSQNSIYSDLLFLKDYIIICHKNDDLLNYSNEILNNYEYYFHKIYDNFDIKIYEKYIYNNLNILVNF